MITCLHPKITYNKYLHQYISAPCGKCDACRCLKSNEWCLRCQLESRASRYCMFVTLTYDDQHLPVVDLQSDYDWLVGLNEELEESISSSSEYVLLCKGRIPLVSVKDCQLFLKRLRSYIDRDLIFNDYEEDKSIRYFIASEYGPTTFRPHYHMLFWFNSPTIYKDFKKLVYKAWFIKNPHSTLSSFLSRNRISRVRFGAERYVSGYLNCDTNLPPILRQAPFCCFHLNSRKTIIGSSVLQLPQIQELFHGRATSFSYEKSESSGTVSISLWRSLEGRLFPKCSGFTRISFYERISLYTISLQPYGKGCSYIAFEEWFLHKWDSLLPIHTLLRQVSQICTIKEEVDREKARRFLRRLWYVSRKFLQNCRSYGFTVNEYVEIIDNYFSRKNYNALLMQLDLQVRFADSVVEGESLALYPFVIDSLFAENYRKLPISTRLLYYNQFGISTNLDYSKSSVYQEKCSLFHNIRLNNTKIRYHKDYVSNHPEYWAIYAQNMFHTFIN